MSVCTCDWPHPATCPQHGTSAGVPEQEPVGWLCLWRHPGGVWNYDGFYRTEEEARHLPRNSQYEHHICPIAPPPEQPAADGITDDTGPISKGAAIVRGRTLRAASEGEGLEALAKDDGPLGSGVSALRLAADRSTLSPGGVTIYCEEARALLAALTKSPPGWRPIETAPWSPPPVLLWRESTQEHFVAARLTGAHGPGWCTPDGYEIFKATHWMPLPSAPQEKGR